MARACPLLWSLLVGSLVWALPARADVVVLKNGARLSGRVVKESKSTVTIKTPHGRMQIPRRQVKEIVKESADKTLLSMARARVKAGASEEAIALYERAAKSKDRQVAKRAQRELAGYRRKLERMKRWRHPPRTPFALPEGVQGKPLEGKTLQEQLDRARRALDERNGLRGTYLLEPMLKANPQQRALRYLYARALQLARKDAEARRELLAVLGRRPGGERSLEALRELARRRLAGEPIYGAPGWSQSWSRLETKHFALYSREALSVALRKLPEALYHEVLSSLGLKVREVDWVCRMQVFFHESAGSLRLAERGTQPARLAPDGLLQVVHLRPTAEALRSLLRGEIARGVLEDAYPTLPRWALWGGARFARGEAARRAARARCRRLAEKAELLSIRSLLENKLTLGKTSVDRRNAEAQGCVLFEALASLRGNVPAALRFASKLEKLGLEKALRKFKVDPAQLEATRLQILERAK